MIDINVEWVDLRSGKRAEGPVRMPEPDASLSKDHYWKLLRGHLFREAPFHVITKVEGESTVFAEHIEDDPELIPDAVDYLKKAREDSMEFPGVDAPELVKEWYAPITLFVASGLEEAAQDMAASMVRSAEANGTLILPDVERMILGSCMFGMATGVLNTPSDRLTFPTNAPFNRLLDAVMRRVVFEHLTSEALKLKPKC